MHYRFPIAFTLATLTLLLLLGSSVVLAANPASAAPAGREGNPGITAQGAAPASHPGGRADPIGPVLPEAPLAVLLPLIGLAAAAGTLMVMHMRRRSAVGESDPTTS